MAPVSNLLLTTKLYIRPGRLWQDLAESRRETSPRPFDSAHRHEYSRWQDRLPRFLQGGRRVFVQEPPSGYNVGKWYAKHFADLSADPGSLASAQASENVGGGMTYEAQRLFA